MSLNIQKIYQQIIEEIQNIPMNEYLLSPEEENNLRAQKTQQIITNHTQGLEPEILLRIDREMTSWGPLCDILEDEDITEIMVNGPNSIWIEKNGSLSCYPDIFFSEVSYRNCLDRLCHSANIHATKEHPCVDGQFESFRLSVVSEELTHTWSHFSLRRHPKNPWSFEKLQCQNWCGSNDIQVLKNIFNERKNFLVIGATGAGKTSVLNSFLQLAQDNERILAIEDTAEITLPNTASLRLVTREDSHGLLPRIDQTQLVRRSLRLRPDRIIMGEIRGSEAKDFLMALATGHRGCFGTLHAQDASQALLRLEMLIQMGAPQWNLLAIRRLIQMSLDYVVVAEKTTTGARRLKGIYRLCSLEENGFLLEQVTELP